MNDLNICILEGTILTNSAYISKETKDVIFKLEINKMMNNPHYLLIEIAIENSKIDRELTNQRVRVKGKIIQVYPGNNKHNSYFIFANEIEFLD